MSTPPPARSVVAALIRETDDCEQCDDCEACTAAAKAYAAYVANLGAKS